MRWWWLCCVLLVTTVTGKARKHRHHKPGRALLDSLSSTTVSEVTAASETRILVPVPLDVAPYSSVTANATCGVLGAEEYCRDTPGKRGVVCDVCEGPDGSPTRRHPPAHAVDGDPATWWQSPILAVGHEYRHVEFVATLPDKMELLHVIIKSGPSPRPLAWSLDISPSENGEDWRMIRAFGDRDHCRRLWDLRPERRRRKARATKRVNRAEKISCSTQFVSPKPLENGEMHVAIGEGVSARRVRVSFRAPHPAAPSHQYYSMRALTLAARCLCHGHATRCAVDAKGAKCECKHGTCGTHCHRCCSGGPWQPHQPCGDTTECSCGERGACTYDDTGAILCVNCTENRAGPLCDRCLFGYYNAVPDGACVPCDCDPEGSDGSCKWDKKQHKPVCTCLEGFTGALCDACEDSGAVFPQCQPVTTPACRCDPRGIVDPSRICNDVCECKANVMGDRCDTCAPGHFGLSADLPEGCKPCYCSHITDSCTLDETGELPRDIILPLGEAWLISDMDANETVEPSIDEQGKPFVINYEVEGWENFYWLSSSFSGEQLTAYGGEIRAALFWGIVRGDTGGNPTVGPDIILISADGTRIASGNTSHETPGELEMSVPLMEKSWYTLGDEPEPCTRAQLLDVLRDLRGIMIRAHYHYDQDEVRLESSVVGGPHSALSERCSCPGGYAGAHCSRCAWSHARVLHAPGTTPTFECVPCACNQHADCRTVEGPCGECQHNTTGAHCERCLPGHYGNPVQGPCKPCACPLFTPSNNFSPNCALASASGDEYVCTQCPDGYTGDHCENCDFGYWGSPTTVGGSCRACACGGSPCHPATGACLVCPPHTEGARCELCQEGYWLGPEGTAGSVVSCVSCACGAGALSAACDARSGRCTCRAGWTGRACDTCAPGHGGLSAGCPACRCGLASIDNMCNPQSGDCTCAPGAAPPSCDTCLDEHYGINATGCLGCNCSSIGAESNACDIRSGQCRCKPHVMGRACDTCEEGYWGLEHGGCRRCQCGPGASACDPVSGACACAEGVGGAQCDHCLPGYYGFGPAGCLPCPECPEGKVCSPTSGRCVCPGGSLGAGCRQCARGYWAAEPGRCQPCECGPGATSNTCDPHTGQCKCRPGWGGTACDECSVGHYGPRCKPCYCNIAGTAGCNHGICPCDSWGRCRCKENVVGEKCDQCLEGTFGLSAENPVGCTACFCFGRAAQCSQAELARAALHAAAPLHVTLQQQRRDNAITNMDQDSLLAIHTHSPEATISLPWPPVPVYVELDKRFLGDRVTSYGGMLKFKVEEEGGVDLSPEIKAKFPLVRIYGRNIVLDHYEHVPASNGTYSIRLHESLWSVRDGRGDRGGRGGRVASSRSALMLALQRVQRLLLRLTTRAPRADDRVHALLLNVSLDTAIPGLSRSEPALGVELCDCPQEYASSSCQEPAVGFWMPPPKVHMTSVAGTIVISLEGDAQPCHCNNRSSKCDPETGHCLNCTGGTAGPRCSVCAGGYYGNPASTAGCQPCPCPSRARNFASGCVISGGRLQCLCKPGYAGPECESCAVGFRRSAAGACVSCACHPRGAQSPRCDARGACRCRDFATGPACDQCLAHRSYMDEDGCKPCDNCTQTLLDAVEDLTSNLRVKANPEELSRIPKPFSALTEFTTNATTLRKTLQTVKMELTKARNLAYIMNDLEAIEHRIFTEANRLKTEASRRQKEAHYLSLESMSALDEVLSQRRKLGELVASLDDFARGERHLSAHRALKEARQLLRGIKEINLSDYIAVAGDVSVSANLQSTAVQEYNYRIDDTYRRLRKLQKVLDEWENKADNLTQLAQIVWTADDTVTALQARVKPRVSALRDVGLRCRLILEDINALSTNNVTDAIGATLLQAQTLGIRFPSMAAELAVLTLAAEEKEGILYNLTPAYKQKYLEPVERHVKHLGLKAKEYKSLFAGSRAAASLGVSAARAWARVGEHVRDAAAAADGATRAAAAAAAVARGPVPVSAVAAKGKAASEDLKLRGAAVLAKAEELQQQLSQLRRGADVVSVALRGVGWAERELGARPEAHVRHTLRAAGARADRVFATSRALYDEASDLRQKVRYHLRRQLAELQRHGDTALGAAQEHVSQISGNTARGAEVCGALWAAAQARATQRRAATAALAAPLHALRHKLQRARHAADTISVSVTSVVGSVGCSRALSASLSGGVTRVTLALSFDGSVRDGTLLHVPADDKEMVTYMTLVVENKKLRLSWDLGSGEGVIVHPEELKPTHDDADHTAYRIEIERIWNTVHLRVERAGGSVVSVSNSTASAAVTLRAAELWLGGATGTTGATGAGLPGCVHALTVDDRTLGLWNTKRQPKEARCTGCTHRWYSAGGAGGAGGAGVAGSAGGGEGSLVWFGGAGYAALRRSTLRPADRRQFSLALTFRTRDHNALLFMALDTANNRSVSLWVRSCRVVFVVQYGGARLELWAGGAHCHGRAAHVQAIRAFAHNNLEKGSLRVNGEETLGSPSPPVQSAAALPDLAEATYWVGGLPPGAQLEEPAPALLGCLGSLTVDREGYDLSDTPTRHGIEPRCGPRTLRSAILEGSGYIELPSPIYRRKAALGISFRARAPSGLLMFRAPSNMSDNEVDDDDGDEKHYLLLTLVKGELELIAAAGKGEMRLRTNGTKYDDGRLYTVRLIRSHKQLEMWVDDERVARGSLAGNAFPQRSGGFYLGGAPPGRTPGTPPLQPFTGTLTDFIVDGQLIGLDTAVNWSGAQLGRADSEPQDEPRTEPRALQAQPGENGCGKSWSWTVEGGAVKFGDGPWSHAAVRVSKKAKHLALALHFRTFAPDGVLLIVPGSKAKQKHYLALMVREGKLRLVVRGRKRKEVSLATFVADGTWRSVSVRCGGSRVWVRAGGAGGAVGARAGLAQRVYVGGPPPPPALPLLPPAIVRVGGFRGCVRRVTVNGRAEDLVRDARAHHNVGQCFPNVEQAAYFAGDAYATLSHSWANEDNPEETTEIEVHFKTSEPNGILLAGGGIVLEIKDGQVRLSATWWGSEWERAGWGAGGAGVSGGGDGAAVSGEAVSACDGAWHSVRGRVSPRALSVRVDGGPPRAAHAPSLADSAPPHSRTLHVAGLPEGVTDSTEGGKNFKGCIREVIINGKKREWASMDTLHNVLLDSCPIQQ